MLTWLPVPESLILVSAIIALFTFIGNYLNRVRVRVRVTVRVRVSHGWKIGEYQHTLVAVVYCILKVLFVLFKWRLMKSD